MGSRYHDFGVTLISIVINNERRTVRHFAKHLTDIGQVTFNLFSVVGPETQTPLLVVILPVFRLFNGRIKFCSGKFLSMHTKLRGRYS